MWRPVFNFICDSQHFLKKKVEKIKIKVVELGLFYGNAYNRVFKNTYSLKKKIANSIKKKIIEKARQVQFERIGLGLLYPTPN